MTINIGEVLPNYTLSRFGTKGLENVQLHDFIGNNKVCLILGDNLY